MDELIFFAVIIFFTILDAIARSRKAKGGGEVEAPDPPQRGGATSGPSQVPRRRPDEGLATYDAEPSHDDRALSRPTRAEAPSRRPSSETMLPGDLLEQLEALAGGRTVEREKARTLDLPDQSPPLPTPVERTEVGTGRAGSSDPVGRGASVGSRPPIGSGPSGRSRAEGRVARPKAPLRTSRAAPQPQEHFVHRAHAEYGTDPSSRSRSEQDVLNQPVERLSDDAAAVRRQLFGRGSAGLRQAFVLKEVLGTPLALREE